MIDDTSIIDLIKSHYHDVPVTVNIPYKLNNSYALCTLTMDNVHSHHAALINCDSNEILIKRVRSLSKIDDPLEYLIRLLTKDFHDYDEYIDIGD